MKAIDTLTWCILWIKQFRNTDVAPTFSFFLNWINKILCYLTIEYCSSLILCIVAPWAWYPCFCGLDQGAGACAVSGRSRVQASVDLLKQRPLLCLQHRGHAAQKWDWALQLLQVRIRHAQRGTQQTQEQPGLSVTQSADFWDSRDYYLLALTSTRIPKFQSFAKSHTVMEIWMEEHLAGSV